MLTCTTILHFAFHIWFLLDSLYNVGKEKNETKKAKFSSVFNYSKSWQTEERDTKMENRKSRQKCDMRWREKDNGYNGWMERREMDRDGEREADQPKWLIRWSPGISFFCLPWLRIVEYTWKFGCMFHFSLFPRCSTSQARTKYATTTTVQSPPFAFHKLAL